MTVCPILVKIMAFATIWLTISSALVLMAPSGSFARLMSMNVSMGLVTTEEPALTKLEVMNVNVQQDTLDLAAKEMSTNAFPILVRHWELKSASNWSTITIAFVVQDGWDVIAKRDVIFAKEILVKMEEFAPTRKDHTTVHVSQATSGPIANLLERLVTALRAETVARVWIAMMAKILDVAVPLEPQAKHASKILVTSALTILVSMVIASTKLETMTVLVIPNGEARIVISAIVQVQVALTSLMDGMKLSISIWRSKNVLITDATRRPVITDVTKNATLTPATTTGWTADWASTRGSTAMPHPEENLAGKSLKMDTVTRHATQKSACLTEGIVTVPSWSVTPITTCIAAIISATGIATWLVTMLPAAGMVWIVSRSANTMRSFPVASMWS